MVNSASSSHSPSLWTWLAYIYKFKSRLCFKCKLGPGFTVCWSAVLCCEFRHLCLLALVLNPEILVSPKYVYMCSRSCPLPFWSYEVLDKHRSQLWALHYTSDTASQWPRLDFYLCPSYLPFGWIQCSAVRLQLAECLGSGSLCARLWRRQHVHLSAGPLPSSEDTVVVKAHKAPCFAGAYILVTQASGKRNLQLVMSTKLKTKQGIGLEWIGVGREVERIEVRS